MDRALRDQCVAIGRDSGTSERVLHAPVIIGDRRPDATEAVSAATISQVGVTTRATSPSMSRSAFGHSSRCCLRHVTRETVERIGEVRALMDS